MRRDLLLPVELVAGVDSEDCLCRFRLEVVAALEPAVHALVSLSSPSSA